jgi:hypothetical protein
MEFGGSDITLALPLGGGGGGKGSLRGSELLLQADFDARIRHSKSKSGKKSFLVLHVDQRWRQKEPSLDSPSSATFRVKHDEGVSHVCLSL